MHTAAKGFAIAAALALGACTHLHGVVEQSPGHPLATAVFSVGRPDGIAVYARHAVDSRGRFDFNLAPTDDDDLYVYDGAADPRLTLQRVDSREFGKDMHIYLPAANPSLGVDPTTP